MARAVSHIVAAFVGITVALCLACAAFVPVAQADEAPDETPSAEVTEVAEETEATKAVEVTEAADEESATVEEIGAEADFVTVDGIAAIDSETAFPSLYEALLASAEALGEDPTLADGGITLAVHGTVVLDRGLSTEDTATFTEEIAGTALDGLNWALIGADTDACLVVASDGSDDAPALVNPGGVLLLRGLSVEGALTLEARDGIVVEFCSFDRTLTCRTDGELIAIADCVFSAGADDAGYAVSAGLGSGESVFVFNDNETAGFSSVCAVDARDAAFAQVYLTSNTLDLVPTPDSISAADTCVLRLKGGPWPTSSIISGGNVIDGATALLVLDASFSAYSGTDEDAQILSVADDSLDEATIEALFELTDGETSIVPDEAVQVALDATFDGTAVAEAAAAASEAALPSPDTTVGVTEPIPMITVSYDANGATAGVAPDPVSVEEGSTIAVENMGSLAYPGYMFEGWNTEPDGSGTFYAVGQIMSPMADMTLYAQWAPTGTVATVPVQALTEAAEDAAADGGAEEEVVAGTDEIEYTEVAPS